ncbi:MAG: hypothetical protein WAW96_19735 [Alphaproteobacteria bacterium]
MFEAAVEAGESLGEFLWQITSAGLSMAGRFIARLFLTILWFAVFPFRLLFKMVEIFFTKQSDQQSHSHGEHGQTQNERAETYTAGSDDPFVTACRTLGLREDGDFERSLFEQRYRALMKGVHPDVVGANSLAAQLNAARDIIRQRKSWR